jgi:hypothetical protein
LPHAHKGNPSGFPPRNAGPPSHVRLGAIPPLGEFFDLIHAHALRGGGSGVRIKVPVILIPPEYDKLIGFIVGN